MRAHLEAAARMGMPEAKAKLAERVSPGVLAYLWQWFLELHGHRGVGPMGPAPLTWLDLDAWARRMRRDPAPWEFDVLSRLDDTFFAVTMPPKAET